MLGGVSRRRARQEPRPSSTRSGFSRVDTALLRPSHSGAGSNRRRSFNGRRNSQEDVEGRGTQAQGVSRRSDGPMMPLSSSPRIRVQKEQETSWPLPRRKGSSAGMLECWMPEARPSCAKTRPPPFPFFELPLVWTVRIAGWVPKAATPCAGNHPHRALPCAAHIITTRETSRSRCCYMAQSNCKTTFIPQIIMSVQVYE